MSFHYVDSCRSVPIRLVHGTCYFRPFAVQGLFRSVALLLTLVMFIAACHYLRLFNPRLTGASFNVA